MSDEPIEADDLAEVPPYTYVNVPLDLPAGTVISITITIGGGVAVTTEAPATPITARYMGQGRRINEGQTA